MKPESGGLLLIVILIISGLQAIATPASDTTGPSAPPKAPQIKPTDQKTDNACYRSFERLLEAYTTLNPTASRPGDQGPKLEFLVATVPDPIDSQMGWHFDLQLDAIQRAIEAYRVRDLSICDLVTRSENAINRLERDIDQAALDLLAMEQPMAVDLRFILSVIKINADLERVGDAAKSISDRVRNMEQMAAVELPVDIPRMATLASEMVRKSLQSFIEADAETARSVLTMDDAVDKMNRAAYKALTKVMEEQSHIAPQALNALMISRALERVADHATNIAEDVIFLSTGQIVRHRGSSPPAK